MYGKKVMEHFISPINFEEIKNADFLSLTGNPVYVDMITFYIKVKDNKK